MSKSPGYALFFEFYSSFQGCAGLVLDDIFVLPQFRKQGIGKALLAHVSAIAIRENYFCIRLEVLDWNEPAIGFFTIGRGVSRRVEVDLPDWRSPASRCRSGDVGRTLAPAPLFFRAAALPNDLPQDAQPSRHVAGLRLSRRTKRRNLACASAVGLRFR